jgi:hypothetical protein
MIPSGSRSARPWPSARPCTTSAPPSACPSPNWPCGPPLTEDDIERIEEGGTEPTIPLQRRLAAALNADVHLTAGHNLGSVWFETHAA